MSEENEMKRLIENRLLQKLLEKKAGKSFIMIKVIGHIDEIKYRAMKKFTFYWCKILVIKRELFEMFSKILEM